MKYDKKALMAATVAGVVGLGSASAIVSAHGAGSNNQQLSIIKKLAEKFNLDEDKVREVFEAEHKTHHEERKAQLEERLDQAVKDGKLTEG